MDAELVFLPQCPEELGLCPWAAPLLSALPLGCMGADWHTCGHRWAPTAGALGSLQGPVSPKFCSNFEIHSVTKTEEVQRENRQKHGRGGLELCVDVCRAVTVHPPSLCPPLLWPGLAISSMFCKKNIRTKSHGVGLTPHRHYHHSAAQSPSSGLRRSPDAPMPTSAHVFPSRSLCYREGIPQPCALRSRHCKPVFAHMEWHQDLVLSLQTLQVQEQAYRVAHIFIRNSSLQ